MGWLMHIGFLGLSILRWFARRLTLVPQCSRQTDLAFPPFPPSPTLRLIYSSPNPNITSILVPNPHSRPYPASSEDQTSFSLQTLRRKLSCLFVFVVEMVMYVNESDGG